MRHRSVQFVLLCATKKMGSFTAYIRDLIILYASLRKLEWGAIDTILMKALHLCKQNNSILSCFHGWDSNLLSNLIGCEYV